MRIAWMSLAGLLSTVGGPLRTAAARPAYKRCELIQECRQYLETAMAHYNARRYPQSLTEFRAAYQRQPEPRVLLNIGRTLHRLGQPRNALLEYEKLRKEFPELDPETASSLSRFVKEAQEAIAAESPILSSEPANSQVSQSPKPARSQPSPAPAAVLLGGGVVLLFAGLGTGVAAAQLARELEGPAYDGVLYETIADKTQTGVALNNATIGLLVSGSVVAVAGAGWLGYILHRRRYVDKQTN